MLKKRENTGKKNKQRGAALLLALVLTVGLIILGSGYVAVVRSNYQLSLISYADVEALHIAEAGVEFAIWEIAYGGRDFLAADGWSGVNPFIRTDIVRTSGGDAIGEYQLTVIDSGSNSYEILSRGFFPSQAGSLSERIVKVVVEQENLFEQAMFGMGSITLSPFVYIDSYDSRLGAYGGANVSSNGDLITWSISTSSPYAADIGSSSVVNGNLTIGVGGDVSAAIKMSPGSSITGTKSTLLKVKTPYSVPDISGTLPYQGSLSVPAHGTATISSSGEYDSITLGPNATLIVDSEVSLYVDGAVNFANHSSMIIDPTVKVSLVINDTLTFGPFAQIVNSSFDPKRFTIYCTDNVASFELGAQGQFYGNVYMPNSDFTVAPFTDYFGSIVANTISLGSNVNYHYDKSLADDPAAPTFNNYDLKKWQGY